MTTKQTAAHTPGPWVVVNSGGTHYVKSTQNDFFRIAEMIGFSAPDAKRDADRLVACVNACEGMDDPARDVADLRARFADFLKLSQQTPSAELYAGLLSERDSLKAQNEELAALVRAIIDHRHLCIIPEEGREVPGELVYWTERASALLSRLNDKGERP